MCPPIAETDNEINIVIEETNDIFLAEIFEINNSENICKIRVVETYKGSAKAGDIFVHSTKINCNSVMDKKGKWLLFGTLNDSFKMDGCAPYFNVSDPHIYPPPAPPPPGSKEEWKTTDDPEWKKKNKTLADRILMKLSKIKTVPNKK